MKASIETMPTTAAAATGRAAAAAAAAAATRRWLCVTHARWTWILRLRGRGMAWRGLLESNTYICTYTVKRVHDIQITTVAAQLQQQWRHLANLIRSLDERFQLLSIVKQLIA